MKKLLAKVISLVCLVALLLTGCGTGGNQSSVSTETKSTISDSTAAQEQTTQAPKEKVAIDLWWWQGDMEQAWRDNMIKDFETENPDIQVNFSIFPWENYWQKVQTAMVAGGLPDLLTMSVAYVDTYAKRDVLTNLHPYIEKDLDMSLYYDEAWRSVRYPSTETGDEYGIPWDFGENIFFYNKAMFDEAKLAYPDDTWTWDTVREAAKKMTKITDKLETTRFGFSVTTSDYFYDTLVYSFGGRIVSDDLSHCMLNEPEATAATQLMADIILKDKSAPKPGELEQNAEDAFSTGIIGMAVSGAWTLDTMKGVKDFKWGVAPVPMGPKGRFTKAWSDSMCIPQQSKHKDEAWEFLKFLISDKGQKLVNLQTRIPVLKSASTDPNWLEPGTAPVDKSILLKYLDGSVTFGFRGGWGEWYPAVSSEVDQALIGQKTVEKALDSATKAVDTILANNR